MPADRTRRAHARPRCGASRRARIPAQAGLARALEGAPGPPALGKRRGNRAAPQAHPALRSWNADRPPLQQSTGHPGRRAERAKIGVPTTRGAHDDRRPGQWSRLALLALGRDDIRSLSLPDQFSPSIKAPTSTRAIVYDVGPTPLGSAQEELPQFYPAPGWVEHDPGAICRAWLSTRRAVVEWSRYRRRRWSRWA